MNFKKYQEGENIWNNYPDNTSTNNVEFTSNNGVISYSGTCTSAGNRQVYINLSKGTYVLKANANKMPVNNNYPCIQVYKDGVVTEAVPNNDAISGSVTFTIDNDVSNVYLRIRVHNGVNYDGFEIRPELKLKVWHDISHYIHNTSTDTLTTLPADVYADGQSATVGLVGNMSQTGTPSPSSIIMPSECGDKTGNLWNATPEQGGFSSTTGEPTPSTDSNYTRRIRSSTFLTLDSGTYTVSANYDVGVYVYDLEENYQSGESYTSWNTAPFTFQIGANRKIKLIFRNIGSNTQILIENFDNEVMLNTGSTALPYEPYGVKIPISSASTTTPVYLGGVESTRKVKKLVLTGQESWTAANGGTDNCFFYMTISDSGISNDSPVISSHFVHATVNNTSTDVGLRILSEQLRIRPNSASTTSKADFQQYLANQYAAGTPVCVWYVLATETTDIVNEPLRKIGDYADTVSGITIPTITGKDSFDVLTTLKPSEVELTYTGWHDATVKEWDGSQWE